MCPIGLQELNYLLGDFKFNVDVFTDQLAQVNWAMPP